MGIRLKGQTSGYVEIKAPATAADNTLTLPNGNGSSNQVLTTDGSGGLTFAAPQLSTDTTPQLGGDLDVNGNDIVTTSNGDIDLDPNGSGQVVFKGNSTRGSGQIKLNCEQNSHGITVKGPPHSSGANYTLTLPNDTGTSGQLLSTNGSGVTSWADVNASPSYSATASGAIANGDTIIVQANGTVKKPTQTINTSTITAPSDGKQFATPIFGPAAAYDPVNKKTLLIYNDENSSGDLKGIVVTVDNTQSGTAQLTYGSDFSISTNAKTPTYGTNAVVYCETAGVFLVVYKGDDNNIECRTVDVSGSSPSVGSEVQVNSNGYEIAAAYDSNADRVVVGYLYSQRKARVITVASGSNPSVGSEVTVDTASNNVVGSGNTWNLMVYDSSAQKVVNLYHKVNSSQTIKRGTAKVGTIDTSANTISFGSAADFHNTGIQVKPLDAVYDPISGKILVSYHEIGDVDMYYAVGTVSGTSISFATSVQLFPSQTATDIHSFTYDSNTQVIAHVYERYTGSSTNNRLYVRTATISGTTVTFGSNETDIFSANNQFDHFGSTYDTDQKRVLFFGRNSGSSNTGEGFAIKTGTRTSDLTTENYIGIADAAYADGATATVQIVGAVDDAQSSLTPGQSYFVQFDGSLALTPDDTSVFAGTAVSATKLIVKG